MQILSVSKVFICWNVKRWCDFNFKLYKVLNINWFFLGIKLGRKPKSEKICKNENQSIVFQSNIKNEIVSNESLLLTNEFKEWLARQLENSKF